MRRSAAPLIILAVLVIGGIVVAGVIALGVLLYVAEAATRPTPRPTTPEVVVQGPLNWAAATDKAKVGNVTVELLMAFHQSVAGRRFGQFESQGEFLILKLRMSNTDPAKLARYSSPSSYDAVDEHGNDLKEHHFGGGFQFSNPPGGRRDLIETKDCDTPTIIAADLRLDPKKCVVTYLVFEKLPDTSKEVRLVMPTSAWGDNGTSVILLRRKIEKLPND